MDPVHCVCSGLVFCLVSEQSQVVQIGDQRVTFVVAARKLNQIQMNATQVRHRYGDPQQMTLR
jgi:hypothetical protein